MLCWIYQTIVKLFLFSMHQNNLNGMEMICFLKEWKEFTVKKSETTGFLEGAEHLPLI